MVTNSAPASDSDTLPGSISISGRFVDVGVTGHPDGLYSRIWYGSSGFTDGLSLATQDCTGTDCSVVKRWTYSTWTHDDPYSSSPINPRVSSMRVGDDANVRLTTMTYLDVHAMNPVATYGLVSGVKVYDTDLTTVIKETAITYNTSSNYTDRRIIGLPSVVTSSGWDDIEEELKLVSKVSYLYDQGDFSDSGLQQDIEPVQHVTANYGDAFSYRGNLTSTTRWNADFPESESAENKITVSSLKYNTAGSVVSKTTPWDGTNTRTVKIGYDESVMFNDGITTRNTYAYPTSVTDPANNSSTVKYRYDIGASVQATSPAPANQSYGKTTKRIFDSIGRLQRNSVYVTTTENSYVRYEYPSSGVHSKVFSTLIDTNSNGPDSSDEVLSESWFDGAGRVRMRRVPHTFSSGTPVTWAGTLTEYDLLGRVTRQSVPTEVDGTFDPTGDDSAFLWTHQKYDWMGRVIRKINTDGLDSPTLNESDILISYEGCGCAGGLITTVQGELVPRTDPAGGNARRLQKYYADILGRPHKTETFEWDGTTVYSTTEQLFNGRDQVVKVTQTDHPSDPDKVQESLATFDGHGRLYQSHRPEQRDDSNNLKYTTYTYNPDDSIQSVTDGRGAVTNLEYNSRGLLIGKSWTVPGSSGITDPSDVTFSYDNLGNRTQMIDGMGVVDYEYNSLSQMTAEVRNFSDTLTNEPTTGVYRFEYTYALTGELKTLTEPFGKVISYANDKAGRTTAIDPTTAYGDLPQNGSAVSGMQYRAFGSMKGADYGNGTQATITYNSRLQPSAYRLVNTSNSQILFGKDYFYTTGTSNDNDGRVKQSIHYDDTITAEERSKRKRTDTFDALGRIKSSDAGDGTGLPGGWSSTGLTNGQFQQDFTYDAFGNTININDRDFNTNVTGCVGCPRNLYFSETTVNNRTTSSYSSAGGGGTSITVFEYDADGRSTKRGTEIFAYNADGQMESADLDGTISDRAYSFDGDGKLLRLVENGTVQNYYSISTLLGATVAELTNTGAVEKSFIVSPNGVRIASMKAGEMAFIFNEPSGADEYNLKMDKSSAGKSSYDSNGNSRSGGSYGGGGPCYNNCPSPYNAPSGFYGGGAGMDILISMRNAEWLKYRMFSLMDLSYRQIGWNDRMARTPGGRPRLGVGGGPRQAPTGQFDDEFHGLDWNPINAEGEVTPVYGYDFFDLGMLALINDPVSSATLDFNGCTLTVTLKTGKATHRASFKAVSGREDGNQNALTSYGPIPDGQYSFITSRIENRYDRNIWSNSKYPDWVANKRINNNPANSREADAYGDWRVKLDVVRYAVQPSDYRSGFYLHGSNNDNGFGSIGCIDLGTNEACTGLLGSLRTLGWAQAPGWFEVKVNVSRTCNPWAKARGKVDGSVR